MGARDRCCCQGCEVYADDFSTDTIASGDWIVGSGGWSIADGVLHEDGTNGLVYTKAKIVASTQRRYVRVKALDAQPGKVFRLAAVVSNDGDSYLYVELYCGEGAVDNGFLRLGRSTSGTPMREHVITYTPGADYTLIACLSEEGIYGTLAEQSLSVWDCDNGGITGKRAGVFNAGIAADYDDFFFGKHALDIAPEIDARCPHCSCECDGHCLPRTLTLTVESTCEHRDGAQFTLIFDETAYPTFKWEGAGKLAYPLSPGFEADVSFVLYCAGDSSNCSGDNWLLCAGGYLQGQCSDDNYPDLCYNAEPGDCSAEVTCDPLELRFGAYTCAGSGPPDPPPSCTETLVITE